jgi:formate dehydrogenase iron-sulfur subunit
MKISRRDFIKLVGASAATLGVGAKFAPPSSVSSAAAPASPKDRTGILIDTTKCIGCKSCQLACKKANNLPLDENPVCLSPTTLSIVDFRNVSKTKDKPEIKPVKIACMHCEDPACVSVCPVGALKKTESGVVAYDPDVCIGCRYCMTACPFGIPKYDWNSNNPKISKCTQACMADGKREQPACVGACPVQALSYGARSDLMNIAKDRMHLAPSRYFDHIYGEQEIGGTSRLYLSSIPFDQFGFRTDMPNEPLPKLTWNAMEKIPYVLGSLAVLLSGIAWWTHRVEKRVAPAPIDK